MSATINIKIVNAYCSKQKERNMKKPSYVEQPKIEVEKIIRIKTPRKRKFSRYAEEAAFLLGQQIKLTRKSRKWSLANLAERAGITRNTLSKIENGDMRPAIGLVLEVATIVGVSLFEQEDRNLSSKVELVESKIKLLPKRIREQKRVIKDDF